MAYNLTQSLDLEASSSQYASITDASQTGLDITGNMTIEAWVNLETAPSDAYITICSKDNNVGNQRGYWFRYADAAGTKKFHLGISSAGTGRSTAEINATLTPGTWTHVAAVYTAASGQFELFLDAVSQGTASGLDTSIFNNSASFLVGALQDSGSVIQFWDGKISLLRVWSTTRTSTDLDNNKCEVLGATANLQAEWTFDNVYTDNSGNGNTLTASGSPVFATDVPATCTSGGGGSVRDARNFNLLNVG